MRLRLPRPRGPVDPERSRRAREANRKGQAEENAGTRLLHALGAEVIVFSQRRRKTDYQGTMQTKGIPDRGFFLRPRGTQPWRWAWWESKAGKARLSKEQQKFKELAQMAGERYVHGGVDALIRFLIDEGELRPDQVAHYYTEPAS